LARQAGYELKSAEWELALLKKERGWRSGGELGRAGGELAFARHHAFQNKLAAENRDRPRSIRRDARRHAQADIERVQTAGQKLEKLLRAEERKLTGALDRATQQVGGITQEVSERERWMDEHPKAPAQLAGLETKLREVESENDHERRTVEGELNPRQAPAPAVELAWSHDDSYAIDHDRDYGFGM
jgi:hypothetical protein